MILDTRKQQDLLKTIILNCPLSGTIIDMRTLCVEVETLLKEVEEATVQEVVEGVTLVTPKEAKELWGGENISRAERLQRKLIKEKIIEEAIE